jgi:hypothetical protein
MMNAGEFHLRQPEGSRDRTTSFREADVARYLVGDGCEVVREMEQLPKHWDRLRWVATELPPWSRSAYGGTLMNTIAAGFPFVSAALGRAGCARAVPADLARSSCSPIERSGIRATIGTRAR